MAIFKTTSYELGFSPEWEGFASAEECTPRLYGVSTGNGNNGVSHMFADYYVRTSGRPDVWTSDPWTLARAATLSEFAPKFRETVNYAMEIDGEAEFTIEACIYNPEDVDPSEASAAVYTNLYECAECNHAYEDDSMSPDTERECPECGHLNEPYDSDEQESEGSYCDANGAWFLLHVFPESEPRDGRLMYDSLEGCFATNLLTMARED